MSSGTKCGRIGCEVRTDEVVAGRNRSLSSRSGQALCWPRIAEIPLQELTSAVALLLCIRTGISELLAHDEWGGSSSPSGKAFSASRKWGGMTAARAIAVRLLCIMNDCRLRSWGGSRLGAHTNLDRAWKGCVYVKVGIIVAVTGGVFVSNRQVD